MKKINEYIEVVEAQLHTALQQEAIIDACASQFAKTIVDGGVIHVFGCGHSQMFGEELCFRTGGLVPINAIKIPQFNIYPKARLSQLMERTEGFVGGVLDSMNISEADTMVIVSVSGRNAAGIDMAIEAKKRGMFVIGVTSLAYANNVTSRHSSSKMLHDVSDLTLDLCGVKGDATLQDARVSEAFGSTSTVVGMSLLNGIVAECIVKLADAGMDPPIWVSGNVDRGDEANQKYMKAYKGKIDII